MLLFVKIAPGVLLPVVLAAGASDPGPLDFASYGAVGLVVVALMLGWLWPKPAVDRLIRSEEQATARAESLADTLKIDVVPVLRDVAKATGTGGPLEKIDARLERIERTLDAPRFGGGGSSA